MLHILQIYWIMSNIKHIELMKWSYIYTHIYNYTHICTGLHIGKQQASDLLNMPN